MKQLMSSKLFLLLTTSSQNENYLTKLENAYEEFASKLLNKLQEETSLIKLFYNLGYVRLELIEICENLLDEEKKNACKFANKSILLIELEQQLIQWQLQNGVQLQLHGNNKGNRENIQWTGTGSDLVELAYAALETKKFNDGEIDINVLIESLCNLFSFEVKDCYDTFRAIRRRIDIQSFNQ